MNPPRSEGFVRMPDAEFEAILTRAAEAMYWAGRTAERAEMAARTVLVALTRLHGAEPGGPQLPRSHHRQGPDRDRVLRALD